MNSKILVLEARNLVFYSRNDEAAFFEWLAKLPCVGEPSGRLRTLDIPIDLALVDEDALREIIAIFHRYGIEKRQLIKLDAEEFGQWFGEPGSYWHDEVFGD